MESLADLGRNGNVQIFEIALLGGGPADGNARRHLVHFVRVVDLAVEEYERARGFLEIAQGPGGEERVVGLLRATDHLELAVITLARALRSLEAVAGESAAPRIDRQLRRAVRSRGGSVTDVRDMIVHVEKHLRGRGIVKGESHALLLNLDGTTASIGPYSLDLAAVAAVLRDLHGLASDFARFRE